jgi:hypothetical protein
MEHITTREAAQFVMAAPPRIAATITAHHLLMSRNAMFAGGVRPHLYCLPILKREIHRETLVKMRFGPSILERSEVLGAITEDPPRVTRTYLTPAHRHAGETIAGWMREAGPKKR